MKSINKKNIKYIFLFVLIILGILKFLNAPYNLYSILNWDYENRMKQNYGICKDESWSFYNSLSQKFNLNNQKITIINDEGHATLEHFFNLDKNNGNNNKYVIILNYNSINNENILNGKYKFLQNYKIKFRQNNCYLLEIND